MGPGPTPALVPGVLRRGVSEASQEDEKGVGRGRLPRPRPGPKVFRDTGPSFPHRTRPRGPDPGTLRDAGRRVVPGGVGTGHETGTVGPPPPPLVARQDLSPVDEVPRENLF